MEEEAKIEDVSQEPVQQAEEERPAYNPALQGCRNVDEFTTLSKIEEGTTDKTFSDNLTIFFPIS